LNKSTDMKPLLRFHICQPHIEQVRLHRRDICTNTLSGRKRFDSSRP
jgi:hypothetical protein